MMDNERQVCLNKRGLLPSLVILAPISPQRDHLEKLVAKSYATYVRDLEIIFPISTGEEFILDLYEDEYERLIKMDERSNGSI